MVKHKTKSPRRMGVRAYKRASREFSSALRCRDLPLYLSQLSVEDLYHLCYAARLKAYARVGVPTKEKIAKLQTQIPGIGECIDFDKVADRFSHFVRMSQSDSRDLTTRDWLPEIDELMELADLAIKRVSANCRERADAWLRAVALSPSDDADAEAMVYLASRGRRDVIDVSKVEGGWYESVCRLLERGGPFGVIPTKLTRKAAAREISLKEAVELLCINNTLPPFWFGSDGEEEFLGPMMMRAADWLGIGGFEPWWATLADELSVGPQQGADPIGASWYLFQYCRSDLGLRLAARRGLDAWLWTLSNGQIERERPWRLQRGSLSNCGMADSLSYASRLAFISARIAPERPDRVHSSAVGLLMQAQLRSGGWPAWENEPSANLLTTCQAIHALAMKRPSGWQNSCKRAADWLWSKQSQVGCWDFGGRQDTILTVLALDSIDLASDSTSLTFNVRGMRKGPNDRRAPSRSGSWPPYDCANAEWHNPRLPLCAELRANVGDRLPEIDVLLVTATPLELRQVLYRMRPLERRRKILKVHRAGETYYLGMFGSRPVSLFQCAMGTGGPGGATLATDGAIALWRPLALIMVGVAFGANPEKQGPADVLVAEQIVPYEHQRIAQKRVHRDPIPAASHLLCARFRSALDWKFERPDGSQVVVHHGRVLSGAKLVDDERFKKRLLKSFPNAIGGEMEGAGVYAAAERSRTHWILVKGVCDWADGHKNDGFQEMAAAAATGLVHHVLMEKTALNGLVRPSRKSRRRLLD